MPLLGNAASGNQVLAQDVLAQVVAASYLVSGTTPSTSANLTLTYGTQEATSNNGTLAQYIKLAAGTLAITASKDAYIDLGYSGTFSGGAANGTLTKVEVANGAAAPALTANSIRLWKVVSSGTAITSVTLLASTQPIRGSMVQKKAVVASTDLTGLSAASWTTWPGAEFTGLTLPLPLVTPAKLLARLFVSAANFSTGAASLQFRLNINSAAAYVYLGQHQWPTAGGAIEAVTMMGLYTPGSYPFTLSSLSVEYQITGAGPNFQLRTPQSTYTWAAMVLELEEAA